VRAATLTGIRKAIKQAQVLWAQTNRGQNATESRLLHIEDKLDRFIKKDTNKGNTWAQVSQMQAPAVHQPLAAVTILSARNSADLT
jgi:hypothetical protein